MNLFFELGYAFAKFFFLDASQILREYSKSNSSMIFALGA